MEWSDTRFGCVLKPQNVSMRRNRLQVRVLVGSDISDVHRAYTSIRVASGSFLIHADGCVVKVSAHGSEGRRFDTRVHQLSD